MVGGLLLRAPMGIKPSQPHLNSQPRRFHIPSLLSFGWWNTKYLIILTKKLSIKETGRSRTITKLPERKERFHNSAQWIRKYFPTRTYTLHQRDFPFVPSLPNNCLWKVKFGMCHCTGFQDVNISWFFLSIFSTICSWILVDFGMLLEFLNEIASPFYKFF